MRNVNGYFDFKILFDFKLVKIIGWKENFIWYFK